MLCAINGTMLPTSTTKGEHEVGKTTLHIAFHMVFGKLINRAKEIYDFAIVF